MPFPKSPSPDTAIILVGGRGTRLGARTEQTPKPLVDVAGRPFLFHVLDYLLRQNIRRVILATGYLGRKFEQTLGSSYRGLAIDYSYEEAPLGTGGAIALALNQTGESEVFVLNGDTYFPVELNALVALQTEKRTSLSMVLRRVTDVSRYGQITLEQNLVTELQEKGAARPGLINGGIYRLNRSAFIGDAPMGAFSLERDLLPRWVSCGKVAGTVAADYFIDIGVPADLQRAQEDLI
jgi:D-glycero-alpha-D-manno-heptose 1-phosphate guanylyltransferase